MFSKVYADNIDKYLSALSEFTTYALVINTRNPNSADAETKHCNT